MTPVDHNYCLILAGGKGRRLWPWSREMFPKQFIDFFGTGRTQLQQTYDRMAKIVDPSHIFVNTNVEYLDLVTQQLTDVPPERIMAEPIHRNTAPSIAWANHRISHIDSDACMIAVPSDQIIFNEEAFKKNVLEGLAFVAANNSFLTMGVKPTRPEPGYGYIQMGDPQEKYVYKVKSFTEKPDREFAKMFMDSGEFYWNTGLFLSNVNHLREEFSRFLPPVLRSLDEINVHASVQEEENYMQEHFTAYPNLSVDMGILEKSDHVSVMKCEFGWADVGTWHGIYEALPKNNENNVVIDSDVILDNCHGNIIKLPKGRLGVIYGLEDFIVAEKDNVLLICKKEDSSDLVRKYVNETQMKKGEDFV